MKTVLAAAIVAATMGTTALVTAGPASADRVFLSFDVGNVAFAYRDGWWDRDHRWHAWRDRDEWREYRVRHYPYYRDYDHDRDRDGGWHDAEWRTRYRDHDDWRDRDHRDRDRDHRDWDDHHDHD
jgi:hypothetical protein